MAKRCKVLITGNGRSGTLTMTHMLKKVANLDVGHEYVRSDGCCSLYFFDPSLHSYPFIPWGPPKGLNAHVDQKFSDFEFEHIFHIVRNPLKCIPSMASIYSAPIMNWFVDMKVVPDVKPRLYKSMLIWYNVNKKTEELAEYRFKIEELQKEWPKLVGKMGMNIKDHPYIDVGIKHRATKSRNRICTWKDLENQDAKLTRKIKVMAKKYGYEV